MALFPTGWTCDRALPGALNEDTARLSVRGDRTQRPGQWDDLAVRPVFGRFIGEDLIGGDGGGGPISIELPLSRDDLFSGAGYAATPRYGRPIITVRSGYYWSTYTYGGHHQSSRDTGGISIGTPKMTRGSISSLDPSLAG